jgi:hypothetical protein
VDNLFEDIQKYLSNPSEFHEGVLTSEEIETLILALAVKRGNDGFTEEEAVNFIRWAERQRIGESLLGLLLKGYIWIDDAEGIFGEEVIIGLTDLGLELKGE